MVIIPYIEKSVKGLITYWLDWGWRAGESWAVGSGEFWLAVVI
jgi:hypothetical protein